MSAIELARVCNRAAKELVLVVVIFSALMLAAVGLVWFALERFSSIWGGVDTPPHSSIGFPDRRGRSDRESMDTTPFILMGAGTVTVALFMAGRSR